MVALATFNHQYSVSQVYLLKHVHFIGEENLDTHGNNQRPPTNCQTKIRNYCIETHIPIYKKSILTNLNLWDNFT